MMERIQILRNVGQFDSVDPASHIAFSKMTMIYAENGRGKTTLAAIFRSLSTGNSGLITERHRLNAQNAPHIIIKASSQIYAFRDGTWSAQLPDIAIFDDNFVVQNIYSGIEVDKEHRQNLHELILGAQGILLNANLQAYVGKIEGHNRNIREKEADIPASARAGLSVEAFCALTKNDKIEAAIQEAERNLAAARSADTVGKQAIFLPLELPSFDIAEINNILQRDLPELQAQAATRVQQHISKLGKGAEGWIGDGMQKIAMASAGEIEDICPFCTQKLEQSPIIAHYESYFSEGYNALKDAITAQSRAIARAHETEILVAFERAVRVTMQNVEFWRAFIEVPIFSINTAEISRAWKAARESVLAVLRAKLASPLEKMNLSSEAKAAIGAYDNHRVTLAELSLSLTSSNAQIALVKERAASANVATLSNDLVKLRATQVRHSQDIALLCKAYLDEKNAKKITEGIRDNARKVLDQYRESIFTKYETAINEFLTKLNAGFRLSSVVSVNNRGGSSCLYNVLINNVPVPITADSGPSFKNTLSAGDRNTLALAFFFASLDQDPSLKQKIVVIDDPMTSLDEHRSLATIHEIRELVKKVKQVIVLSHSKSFLCQIWEWADKNNRSALKIARTGQSSVIDLWDVHQDSITDHDKRHAIIKKYITHGNSGNEREVATALRPILEAFLRVAYPIAFPPGTMLGEFHKTCMRGLGIPSSGTPPPILSSGDTTELRQLIDYANKFHHDTNSSFSTQHINEQELLGFCKRTLRFAQRA